MILLHFLLLSIVGQVLEAQSCWRNTQCSNITEASFPGIWDANIFAPNSRTIPPKSVISEKHNVFSYPGVFQLSKNGSSLVYDFGIEVGGIATFQLSVGGSGEGTLGVAFTEAKNWIGEFSDSSNGGNEQDGALFFNFPGPGNYNYTMPDEKLRGGFRYMTVFLISETASGYFHSNDETLNAIWYSGAYTLQTDTVPVHFGRWWPPVNNGWSNNGTLLDSPGDTIIVDGAKRDRATYSGDLGVAAPSYLYSLGDTNTIRNGIQTMYDHQNAAGALPYVGPPMRLQDSDTYHMWAMVQPPGLLVVTGTGDWARHNVGTNMSEAQMILYRVLSTGADLATWIGDTTGLSANWTAQATDLRTAIMKYCWDATYGAFKDNAGATTVYPQDANSLAIAFGVVDANSTEAQLISTRLTDTWTPIGADGPELPNTISPYMSSFEIQAHLIVGQAQRALELIRRSWGWYKNFCHTLYLYHPNGTGSTHIEGYSTDGTFGYVYGGDHSYDSHAHGWATGPTSTLSEFVVGLRVSGPAGITWNFAPRMGDLSRAEGGFTTRLGKYQAKWIKTGNGTYNATYSTPPGTSGNLILPILVRGKIPKVILDGKKADPKWYERRDLETIQDTITFQNIGGGYHTIEVN